MYKLRTYKRQFTVCLRKLYPLKASSIPIRRDFLTKLPFTPLQWRISLRKLLFFPRLSHTEATYRHHLIIDGQFVSLDIMDTAGKVCLILLLLSVIRYRFRIRVPWYFLINVRTLTKIDKRARRPLYFPARLLPSVNLSYESRVSKRVKDSFRYENTSVDCRS